MNKPATKEPSMDEILSSIRQIIADDDAAAAPPPARPPVATTPAPPPRPVVASAAPKPEPAAAEPLPLSTAQIVSSGPPAAPETASGSRFSSMLADLDSPVEPEVSEPMAGMLAGEPQLVDPEDIAFEADPHPAPAATPSAKVAEPTAPPPQAKPAPRPPASVAQAAPLPDPALSEDMAEKLLAPATDAAVQGAISRLGAVAGMGIGGMTVEAMIREMLRPMLKDWLDENLPALVERMVEKEIARISRGVK